MTDAPAEPTLIERLARHLALHGGESGEGWRDHVDAAAGILAIIEQPDAAMRDAGDAAVWRAMIRAALIVKPSLSFAPAGAPPEGGADEEGDIALPQDADLSRASWVHIKKTPDH